MNWINQSIDYYIDSNKSPWLLKKVLVGLPFHGIVIENENKKDQKAGMMNAEKFQNLINTRNIDLNWNPNECEHQISFKSESTNIVASYPTKKFFSERIDLIVNKDLAGAAIWDLAQGLESFLDEF